MTSLKTILMGLGILAMGFVCACAGSRVGQLTTPVSQKKLNTPDQPPKEKAEPFVFEQDEYNVYM